MVVNCWASSIDSIFGEGFLKYSPVFELNTDSLKVGIVSESDSECTDIISSHKGIQFLGWVLKVSAQSNHVIRFKFGKKNSRELRV